MKRRPSSVSRISYEEAIEEGFILDVLKKLYDIINVLLKIVKSIH